MTGEFSLTGYESGGARVIGEGGGQGDPREITRGSKWKIPGNSLKTTQNILWLLLVLFFCSGCYYSPAQNSRFPFIITVGSLPSFFLPFLRHGVFLAINFCLNNFMAKKNCVLDLFWSQFVRWFLLYYTFEIKCKDKY